MDPDLEFPAGQPAVTPPRRRYAERAREGPRDVDAAERATRLHALAWSLAVVVLVFAVSNLAAALAGISRSALYLFWLGGVVAGAIVYRIATLVATTGATLFGRIQHPTGESTPPRREYSRAKALIAQGHFVDAIAAYEVAVADYPNDPEPYLGIARIYRDHLDDAEEAVTWFKRARADASMAAGLELLVTQEIIEIFRTRIRVPQRSMPELARLIDRFPDHPSTAAVRTELAELRRTYVREAEHDAQ